MSDIQDSGTPDQVAIWNRRQAAWRTPYENGASLHGIQYRRRRLVGPAREAYDRGYHCQKWYFTKAAKDGPSGMKENIEFVRVLREELRDAYLMFDNHGIRYYDDVDYSVELCRAVASYKPFWIEEPICPEHVDGYTRLKEESGVKVVPHITSPWIAAPHCIASQSEAICSLLEFN